MERGSGELTAEGTTDIGFFSTLHLGFTPTDVQGMYLLSVESFLRRNRKSTFSLVMVAQEGSSAEAPEFVKDLSDRYGERFRPLVLQVPGSLLQSKVLRYALRFGPEVSRLVGATRLVSMDLDMYHTSSLEVSLESWVDWGCVNACLDLYGDNPWVLSKHNTTHRPYVNAGFVAWDQEVSRPIMDLFIRKCVEVADLSEEERAADYQYIELDALNYVLAYHYPELLHVLPDLFNHSPRAHGSVQALVAAGMSAAMTGVHVLHIMSYQPQRSDFFRVAAETEGWYNESLLVASRESKELRVVVISHNQAKSIPKMKSFLDKNFHGCPVVTVLDRCTDDSQGVADSCGMPYVVNREGEGFLAGRMRDIGLQVSGEEYDTLFLDGDRIPGYTFNVEATRTALSLFDMTILPIAEGEFREWFLPDAFIPNPNYGTMNNHVFTCGIVVRKEAIKAIMDSQDGLLFVKDFDGQFGEEDQYLGDVAFKLGLTCGGAPKSMALSGGFRPDGEREGFAKNVAVRNRLRAALGYAPPPPPPPNQQTLDRINLRDRIRVGGSRGQL